MWISAAACLYLGCSDYRWSVIVFVVALVLAGTVALGLSIGAPLSWQGLAFGVVLTAAVDVVAFAIGRGARNLLQLMRQRAAGT